MNAIPCIFNAGEYIIQQEVVETKGYAIPVSRWDKAKPFFAINPVRGFGDSRKGENTAVMRNFLYEFDTIPLETQKAVFQRHRDMVSMATYSGGKSIHMIIQVADTPETKDEYRYVWKLLRDKYFPLADRQCNDRLRLSRTPNANRDNGKKQVLIWNRLQPLDIKWRPLYKSVNAIMGMGREYRKATSITRTGKPPTYEAECVLNGDYPQGGRDEAIRVGVPFLYYNGYTLDEVLGNNMSERNNPATIRNYWHKLENGGNE